MEEVGFMELLLYLIWFVVLMSWLTGILHGIFAIVIGKWAKNIFILLFFDVLLLASSFMLVMFLD
ncbi:MAG: hypothetical protein ACRCWR_00310, partial [Saezia sp.]